MESDQTTAGLGGTPLQCKKLGSYPPEVELYNIPSGT